MDQIDNINTNLESQNNAIQVEVIQMSLPKSKFNLNVNLALKQECKCRQLAPVSNFVAFEVTHQNYDDNMRWEYLLSVLESETKRPLESIGCVGLFYATALKALKRDFAIQY